MSKSQAKSPPVDSTPAPPLLDLTQFEGFTPGPWAARRLGPPSYAVEVCYGNAWPLFTGPQPEHATRRNAHDRRAMADATLAAAAPALLAECQRQRAEIERLRGAGMNMLNAAHWLLITPDSHNDQTLLRLSARVMKRVLGVEISDLDSKPDPREVEIARLRAALVATGSRLTTAARAFYGTGTRSALSAAFDGWKADAEAARAALSGPGVSNP